MRQIERLTAHPCGDCHCMGRSDHAQRLGYLLEIIDMPEPALENGLETFIQTSSLKIKTMLQQAVDLMTNTKDLSHGIEHIRNLLKNTNRFFKSTGDQFPMDKEVLHLALYWHDVWKSQHKPTRESYLFQQFYEGLGSMFMFKHYARAVGLSPGMIRSVSYAIRKHSAFQRFPARTLEAQLLWDVDTLDVWNSQRTQGFFKNLGWANIAILDSYMFYMKKVGFRLNFEWTRDEVRKRKRLFFEEMSRFREFLIMGGQGL